MDKLRKLTARLRLYIWWLYSSKVDDPFLRSLAEEAARIVGVRPFKNIRLCRSLNIANAAVVGFRCRSLVVTQLLLELLSPEELRAVFLHEYSHCKLRHQLKLLSITLSVFLGLSLSVILVTLNIANELLSIGVSVALILASYIATCLISRGVAKRFELEADCLAVSKLGNPEIYIGILKKMRAVNGEVSGLRLLLAPHPPTSTRIAHALLCASR